MQFRNDEVGMNWGELANDYVLDMTNKRIKYFLKNTHTAKVETERKMRQELDKRILSMRTEKLNQNFGLEFVKRIRYYIKAYYAMDENDYMSPGLSSLMMTMSPVTRRQPLIKPRIVKPGSG